MYHVPGTIEVTIEVAVKGGFATISRGHWTDDKGYTQVGLRFLSRTTAQA